MKISPDPPLHLTYCLNVHPGETWEENFRAISNITLKIRENTAPDQAFGLGLRLGHEAALSLASGDTLNRFKDFLRKHSLYVFTINGFPHGAFHGVRVKENVYAPDWRSSARLEYTTLLSDILSRLLPEDSSGSISTVPGSYRAWITSDSYRNKILENLMLLVAHLARLKEKTGKEVHLGLEPEPDCFLETTEEVVRFFSQAIFGKGRKILSDVSGCSLSQAEKRIARHLGICFDTCHMSLQFENLAESINLLSAQGIRLSKIQVSSALRVIPAMENRERLKDFCDPVYLHQVKVRGRDKKILSFGDLPDAIEKWDWSDKTEQEWRIHFHAPLYLTGLGGIGSTAEDLTPEFFSAALSGRCSHFEIETYTFHVLPEPLRKEGIIQSISREYSWVLRKFKKTVESAETSPRQPA